MQVNMLEAKTQLSKLVEAALRGEEVLIANRGHAVVRLVKLDGEPERRWGAWAGRLEAEAIDAAFGHGASTQAPAAAGAGPAVAGRPVVAEQTTAAAASAGAAAVPSAASAAPDARRRKTIARRVAGTLKSP